MNRASRAIRKELNHASRAIRKKSNRASRAIRKKLNRASRAIRKKRAMPSGMALLLDCRIAHGDMIIFNGYFLKALLSA